MKQKQRIPTLLIALFIFAIGLAVFLVFHKDTITIHRSGISATVTGVIDKPNQAEDGRYDIAAQDVTGHRYEIHATGYLNTPLSPEDHGEACVSIPKVKVGDKISFNLPKFEGQKGTFDICYKKNLSGYYFAVD